MSEKDVLIEACGLTFSYQGEAVLRDVGFAVAAGDFAAIIGANGAGKSTLLRLLLGELEPQSGYVRLLGQTPQKFRSWQLIGYVAQGGAALADGFPATAAEVVAMGLYGQTGPLRRMKGAEKRRRVEDALAAVEMLEFSGRMIGKLSGGQVQRVLVARALAAQSRLLLLDEPTTGVDSESSLSLYRLLKTLNRQNGLTVLMVTHDIARAAEFTTRTLCLEHGSMVELTREQLEHELAHKHKH